jgi:hypothetical protein
LIYRSPEPDIEIPAITLTELFTFDGDKVIRIEVYFGWDL